MKHLGLAVTASASYVVSIQEVHARGRQAVALKPPVRVTRHAWPVDGLVQQCDPHNCEKVLEAVSVMQAPPHWSFYVTSFHHAFHYKSEREVHAVRSTTLHARNFTGVQWLIQCFPGSAAQLIALRSSECAVASPAASSPLLPCIRPVTARYFRRFLIGRPLRWMLQLQRRRRLTPAWSGNFFR